MYWNIITKTYRSTFPSCLVHDQLVEAVLLQNSGMEKDFSSQNNKKSPQVNPQKETANYKRGLGSNRVEKFLHEE